MSMKKAINFISKTSYMLASTIDMFDYKLIEKNVVF